MIRLLNPDPPVRRIPGADWAHYQLYKRVHEALHALPAHFRTRTTIEGIMVTDIYTLNATLGAAIEQQVVETLNSMRTIWDPEERYVLYRFVRQAQTFPDVLLRKFTAEEQGDEIIMGIELKGWYLLAKEREPSFRFSVTPDACAVQDLVVIVPWALSNVISGSPQVFDPYIEPARYAAEYRNYWWEHVRASESDRSIDLPPNIRPYPAKSDVICDKPRADSGGNFGRYARTGLMDDYLASALEQKLCGLEAKHWLAFFQALKSGRTSDEIRRGIASLIDRVQAVPPDRVPGMDLTDAVEQLVAALRTLADSLAVAD